MDNLIAQIHVDWILTVAVPLLAVLLGSVTTVIGVRMTFKLNRRLEYERRKTETLSDLLRIIGQTQYQLRSFVRWDGLHEWVRKTELGDRLKGQFTDADQAHLDESNQQQGFFRDKVQASLSEARAISFSLGHENLGNLSLSQRVDKWRQCCEAVLKDSSKAEEADMHCETIANELAVVLEQMAVSSKKPRRQTTRPALDTPR